MRLRLAYSTAYDPPAAVVPLEVRHPREASAVLLPAVIDTGADITMLPVDLAAQLGLPNVGRVVVSGLDGLPRILPVRAAGVRVAGVTFIVEAACHGTEALVGRDVLNRLIVRLNGPAKILDIHSRRRP